jgi:hypothetical protein
MCSRRPRHSPPGRRTLSKMESAPKVMRIAETAKVFVLEDSPERIAWFRQRIPQALSASNAEIERLLSPQPQSAIGAAGS